MVNGTSLHRNIGPRAKTSVHGENKTQIEDRWLCSLTWTTHRGVKLAPTALRDKFTRVLSKK